MRMVKRVLLLVVLSGMLAACATPTVPSNEYLLMDNGLQKGQIHPTKRVQ